MPEAKKTSKGMATPAVSENLALPLTPPEVSENLVDKIPELAAPALPPSSAAADSISSVLQSVELVQEQELSQLQTRMDRFADEFADRAAAIVRSGLTQAYSRANTKILTLDFHFFGSPPLSNSQPAALPQENQILEGAIEC